MTVLDFVSFNIRCCDDPDGNSIEERAPRLSKVLEPLNADIITFQEVRPKWVPEIKKYFADQYEIFLSYRSEEKPEGLISLWKKERFSCVEKGHFWFSDTPNEESLGWDEKYHCPRICSYSVLQEKGSGVSFLVMNTHFGFGDRCQTRSVKMIKDFRERFERFRTIVAGDFNMNPSSLGYKEMVKIFVDANEVTARDRRATYHAYAPSPDQQTHIDYIFCDQQVLPESFRILDDRVNGKFPSDHFGIYARLLL